MHEQDNCTVCVKTVRTSLWFPTVDASALLTRREWAGYFGEIKKNCLIGCRYMTQETNIDTSFSKGHFNVTIFMQKSNSTYFNLKELSE